MTYYLAYCLHCDCPYNSFLCLILLIFLFPFLVSTTQTFRRTTLPSGFSVPPLGLSPPHFISPTTPSLLARLSTLSPSPPTFPDLRLSSFVRPIPAVSAPSTFPSTLAFFPPPAVSSTSTRPPSISPLSQTPFTPVSSVPRLVQRTKKARPLCSKVLCDFRSLQAQRDSFVLNSVAASSRQTYSTGIRRWLEFVSSLGTTSTLSRIPPEWHAANRSKIAIPRPWREDCVTIFLTWLRCDPRSVTPKTAFNYLSAVRFFLINAGIDVSFLSSTFVRSTKLGMVNLWRLQPGNTVAARRALPLSIDMILATRDAFRRPLSLQDLSTFTAMIFAFSTASRVSEYLPKSRNVWTHAILSDYVLFSITKSGGTQLLPAHCISHTPLEAILGCLVIIRTRKNDPDGVGHRYYFPRGDVSPTRLFDFTTTMWDYALVAKPLSKNPFFECSSPFPWCLTRSDFNKRLKLVASRFGLDPRRVSSHSLRAGAATALGAANVPDYVIKNFGGWSSDAFLGYVRASTNMYASIHDILAQSSSLSRESLSLVTHLDPDQFQAL